MTPTGFVLPAAETWVKCAGRRHRLRWADGQLRTIAHPDADRERTLAVLGGESYRCLELVDMWTRHASDLDVLMRASRGPGDPLEAAAESADEDVATDFGWYGPGFHGAGHPHLFRPPDDLTVLLGLGDGLPERLVAGVVDHWTSAVGEPGDTVAAASSALHAALYGRVRLAVHSWLGDGRIVVDVQMVDPAASATLTRNGRDVAVGLPFRWLRDVWVPGLSTVMGRFCLDVTRVAAGEWSLRTVGPDGGPVRAMSLRF